LVHSRGALLFDNAIIRIGNRLPANARSPVNLLESPIRPGGAPITTSRAVLPENRNSSALKTAYVSLSPIA